MNIDPNKKLIQPGTTSPQPATTTTTTTTTGTKRQIDLNAIYSEVPSSITERGTETPSTQEIADKGAAAESLVIKVTTQDFQNPDQIKKTFEEALKNGKKIQVSGIGQEKIFLGYTSSAVVQTDEFRRDAGRVTTMADKALPTKEFFDFLNDDDNQKYLPLIGSVHLFEGEQSTIKTLAKLPALTAIIFNKTKGAIVMDGKEFTFPALKILNLGVLIASVMTKAPQIALAAFPELESCFGAKVRNQNQNVLGPINVALKARREKVEASKSVPAPTTTTTTPTTGAGAPTIAQIEQKVDEIKLVTEVLVQQSAAGTPASSASFFPLLAGLVAALGMLVAYLAMINKEDK